jgi:hypothetical protein
MQRTFKLAFAAVPATSDRNFMWILEPLTAQAYSRARGGLRRDWRDGLVSEADRRELFTFRDGQSTLASILADLEAAAITPDEVEVLGGPGFRPF